MHIAKFRESSTGLNILQQQSESDVNTEEVTAHCWCKHDMRWHNSLELLSTETDCDFVSTWRSVAICHTAFVDRLISVFCNYQIIVMKVMSLFEKR